jgi:hypothetical protein
VTQAGGGDGQDARPAAGVHERAGRQAGQQLEAAARGGVLPRAERHAGVDHHVEQPGAGRRPRRAHQQAARHLHRLVERAQGALPVAGLGPAVDAGGHPAPRQGGPEVFGGRGGAGRQPEVEGHRAIAEGALLAAGAELLAGGDEGQRGVVRPDRDGQADELSGRRA